MQNKWMRRLLPLLVLAAAAAIVMVMVGSRAELPRRESAVILPVVEVVTVKPTAVPVTVSSRGTVTAKMSIELVSEVSGRVDWVAPEFVEGGIVTQGTTLLRIDPIDYEVALSAAQAALASAKFSLAEVEVLVMRAAMEEAEAQVEASKVRLRQAEVDLANTTISVPFDAIIDTRQVDFGQYVQAGSPLTKLLGISSVEVRLPLLAADVPFVQYGQSADGSWPLATLTARFGKIERSWQARLVRLEQRVDPQPRVFYLVAEVDAPYDTSIHPWPLSVGLFVEADIQATAIPRATRIPRSALHGDAVYIVQDGAMHRRSATVWRREQDSVIIGQGRSSGDQVILSRMDVMAEGTAVSVAQ